MKYLIVAILLFGTVTLMGDRSGYEFPPRGRVTLEQARILTPLSLVNRLASAESFAPLEKQIQRFGMFDDLTFLAIVIAQISISLFAIFEIRKSGRFT